MRSGKFTGENLDSPSDDIERIFELSRADETARPVDFQPTLVRLKAQTGNVHAAPSRRLFSWPRLMLAGMTAVIVVFLVGLLSATLLSSKVSAPVVASQPVLSAATAALTPTSIVVAATVPVVPTTASNPAPTTVTSLSSSTGVVVGSPAVDVSPTPLPPTVPASPVLSKADTPPDSLVAPEATALSSNSGPVNSVSPSTQANPTKSESEPTSVSTNSNPPETPLPTQAPQPTPTINPKLALATPLTKATPVPGKNAPGLAAGTPVKVFGTLVTSSGGSNGSITLRTSDGIITVNLAGLMTIYAPVGTKPDLTNLKAGDAVSATGTWNDKGQLDATSLELNATQTTPLVNPGYPEDTK